MLTARDVEKVTFTGTRLRRGYDEREVDEFLRRVASTLHQLENLGSRGSAPEVRAVTPEEVSRVRFTQTQARNGYDEGEVDAFLDKVVETLRHHAADADIRVPALPDRPELSTSVPSPVQPSASFLARLIRALRGDP